MPVKRATRGILGALGSLVASAAVFFIAREGMTRTSLPVFLFYWYLFAVPFYGGLILARPQSAAWRLSFKRKDLLIFYLTMETLSVLGFFASMHYLTPAVASFIGPTHVFFMVAIGVLFLGERFVASETAGGGLILAGMFLLAYTSEEGGRLGISMMIAANILWAVSHACVKKLVETEDPLALAHLRSLVALGMSVVLLIVTRTSPVVSDPGLLWVLFAGAIFGPFLNMITRYIAVQNIEISKVALIASQHPVVVLIIALLLGRGVPEGRQIAGGLLTLWGSVVLITGRMKAEEKPEAKPHATPAVRKAA